MDCPLYVDDALYDVDISSKCVDMSLYHPESTLYDVDMYWNDEATSCSFEILHLLDLFIFDFIVSCAFAIVSF